MDQRELELLDKQLRHLPPQYDGAAILMLLSMFFAGVIFGSIWFGHQNERTWIASNDAIAATTLGE
jgi:hypothetical protein